MSLEIIHSLSSKSRNRGRRTSGTTGGQKELDIKLRKTENDTMRGSRGGWEGGRGRKGSQGQIDNMSPQRGTKRYNLQKYAGLKF